MKLESIVQNLEQKLRNKLPGPVAHQKMMPSVPNHLRFRTEAKTEAMEGSVLILLYADCGKIYLPLMRRPVYDGAHSGQISFPGGKMEKSDNDLVDTALREAYEEVGIKKEDVKILGTLSTIYIAASNFNVLPVVAYADARPSFLINQYEVEEIIETELLHLLDAVNIKYKEMIIGEYTLQSPYYDVQGHVVWGATAMMISEFLTILADAIVPD